MEVQILSGRRRKLSPISRREGYVYVNIWNNFLDSRDPTDGSRYRNDK